MTPLPLMLRLALNEAFQDQYHRLVMYCYDSADFRPVYDRLTIHSPGEASHLIELMLRHAGQNERLSHQLVTLLQQYDQAIYTKYWSQPQPNLTQLRQRLMEMDDTDLDFFCLAHFPTVKDNFTDNMAKNRKVVLLLTHCRKDNYQSLMAALS